MKTKISCTPSRLLLMTLLMLHGSSMANDAPANQAASQTVLHFNLPVNTSWINKTKETIIEEICPLLANDKPAKDSTIVVSRVESETTARVSYSAAPSDTAPSGYVLTAKYLTSSMKFNNIKVEDESVTALPGTVVRYELDKEGRVKSIQGYEEFIKKIKATTDAPTKQALGDLLDENTWTAEGKAETENQRLLIGRTLPAPDTTWQTITSHSFTPGLITPLATNVRARERLLFNGRDCIKLGFYGKATSPWQMQEIANRLNKMSQVVSPVPSKVSRVEVIVTGEQIVDVETLLVHSTAKTTLTKKWVSIAGDKNQSTIKRTIVSMMRPEVAGTSKGASSTFKGVN